MLEQITIAGAVFNVPIRYGEGYTLNEREAAVLNQAFHDALRNNFATKVKKGLEAGKTVDDLQVELDAYAENYQFGVRNGANQIHNPVTAEAIDIAKKKIRAEMLAKGKKPKDLDGREIIKQARVMATSPTIIKLAQRRVAEIKALLAQ